VRHPEGKWFVLQFPLGEEWGACRSTRTMKGGCLNKKLRRRRTCTVEISGLQPRMTSVDCHVM
jgi:hypothetical protein